MFNKENIKKPDWVLFVILVVGGIARYWGINFGLPHTECRPDETIIVSHALGFFSGDFNPHYFNYPTFYMYIIFCSYVFYFLLGKISGRYSSTSDILEEYVKDPTNFYLIDRFISAFLGTLTIIIVYKITQKLFDRKTAIISSLFLSLAYLHVRDSHFGVTDVPMTFMIMLSILMILKIYQEKTVKNYAICGLLAGLATSTKYNAMLVLITMGIVHFVNTLEEKSKNRIGSSEIDELRAVNLARVTQYGVGAVGIIFIIVGIVLTPELVENLSSDGRIDSPLLIQDFKRVIFSIGCCLTLLSGLLAILPTRGKLFLSEFIDKRISFFAVLFIFAFLLGTPFALLDFKDFLGGFFYEVGHLNRGHGLNLGIGWWYHLRFTLPLGLGWSLFFAFLAGSLILVKSDTRKTVVLLSFPLTYYLVVGKGYTVFLRYMIPMIPFACIAAAVFVIFISKRVVRSCELPFSDSPIILFLATLIVFQSAYRIAQFDGLLTMQDNRLIAAEWVDKNVKENSSIYQMGTDYPSLKLYHSLESLEYLEEKHKEIIAKGKVGEAKILQAYIDNIKNKKSKGYKQWNYKEERDKFSFDNKEQNKLPEYIVKNEYPVKFKGVPKGIEKILGDYYLRKSFKVISMDNRENWFDRIDSFYMPFAGFRDVQRPGPNIYIYEKKRTISGQQTRSGL